MNRLAGLAAILLAVVAVWTIPAPGIEAHPGGTDGNGCHVCRTNCTEKWGIPYDFYHRHNPVQACFAESAPAGPPAPPPPPPNQAPAASFGATSITATAGEQLQLRVDASDSDGSIVAYRWNFDDLSPEQTTSSPSVEHVYQQPGSFVVTAYVTDDDGAETFTRLQVTMEATPTPTPTPSPSPTAMPATPSPTPAAAGTSEPVAAATTAAVDEGEGGDDGAPVGGAVLTVVVLGGAAAGGWWGFRRWRGRRA